MIKKKYILLDRTSELNGHILHQIQAIEDFDDVKAGDLGGWIEKEENLSQYGKCWVKGGACVYDDALVEDDAKVLEYAQVYGSAVVSDSAIISGYATVYDKANVYEDAVISGKASISGSALVHRKAEVYGNAKVLEGADITNLVISGDAIIGTKSRK